MADYYVLEQDPKAHRAKVAFHFSTPAGTNTQTLSYSDCIAEDESVEKTSAVPAARLDAGAQTALTNGTLYELVTTIEYDGNSTNAEKLAAIQAKFTSMNTVFQANVLEIYKFWGAKGTVA